MQILILNHLPNFMRPLSRNAQGASGIEFALVAPLLALVLALTIDLALAVRAQMAVQNAASAGAHFVVGNGWDSIGITGAVTAASETDSVSADPAPSLMIGCPSGTAIVAASASAICSDGQLARHFVTISASAPRPSLFGSSIGLPETVKAQLTIEVR